MKPVLITGATGFLGKHLVERLRAEGQPLRVLLRGASPWSSDIEVTPGDINSREAVRRAMQGAGQVYHLAGAVSRDPKDDALMYQVHVEGTRNVCEAALEHRPDKLVIVSSSGSIAVSKEPVIHNEESGYKHEVVGQWAYYMSKIFAEKLALSYVRLHNLPVVIVNPALLLGPGDDRNSSTNDVAMLLDGQILALPLGGMSFVDARDAAAGLAGAMHAGRIGERYMLGGVNWTFRRIIQEVGRIAKVGVPRMQPSLSMSLWSARLLRNVFRLKGLDDVTVRMSALFWYCDSSKAAAELGFHSRDPLETLADTVADIRRRRASSRASQS
ncbi:MAG: NAD-dependent epimerase/dehydratase family protein [Bryobacteraceae bacterium]